MSTEEPFDITEILGQADDPSGSPSSEALKAIAEDMAQQQAEKSVETQDVPPGATENVLIVSPFTRIPKSDDPAVMISKLQDRIIELERACLDAQVSGNIEKCISVLGSPYTVPPHEDQETQ